MEASMEQKIRMSPVYLHKRFHRSKPGEKDRNYWALSYFCIGF
jgi:hypothetical protein